MKLLKTVGYLLVFAFCIAVMFFFEALKAKDAAWRL